MEITPKATKVKSVYSSPCNSVESSPCEHKEEKSSFDCCGNEKASSTAEFLTEGEAEEIEAPFTSPFSVAKRLCVEDLEEAGQQVSADSQETVNNPPVIMCNVDVNRNESRTGSERFSGLIPEPTHLPSKDLSRRQDQLKKEVKDKMETLRRLKMVKMYRSKNDLTQLQTLIDKWRSCAQAALWELQSDVPIDGGKASLSELIDLFGLDDRILHFDRTEEDFTT